MSGWDICKEYLCPWRQCMFQSDSYDHCTDCNEQYPLLLWRQIRVWREIPLACAGIIAKVNMVFMAVIIGISQGTQPIVGFNYGAQKYGRVKKTYLQAVGLHRFCPLLRLSASRYFRGRLSLYLVREVNFTLRFLSGISRYFCF